ncbi:Hsp20/alpha crystallin family protein [Micromonospora sp. NPDC050784]|uniref:Hsp20/alpha crystallin family protein n=1 Tax=Micromonospora sp. NPDC050784 TaxID=3364281 RepID=UPI0037AB7F68
MTSATVSRWLPAGLAPLEISALSQLPNTVRIEEHVDDKRYAPRAEVPGCDPVNDITVTYHDGALRLQVRRGGARKDKAHTEFAYGAFDRTVRLSHGIDEQSIRASYLNRILEIHAKVTAPQQHRAIPITVGNGAPATKPDQRELPRIRFVARTAAWVRRSRPSFVRTLET